jgi:hypothetical protein
LQNNKNVNNNNNKTKNNSNEVEKNNSDTNSNNINNIEKINTNNISEKNEDLLTDLVNKIKKELDISEEDAVDEKSVIEIACSIVNIEFSNDLYLDAKKILGCLN